MSKTPEQRSEKFKVTDHSATAPLLQRLITDRVIKILPAAYSPNALTLTGGAFALASACVLWLSIEEMQAGTMLGIVAMFGSVLLLVIYAVFDQLDGMQARKLGRSSSFGDFLDHWVDTWIANSLTLPIMVMLEISQPLLWLMMMVTAMAFWAHNWETRNINRRELPVIGGLESIWTALMIMSVTAVFGFDVWRWETVVPGVQIIDIFYWYGIAALVWVILKSLMGSRDRLLDYLRVLLVLLPISLYLLVLAEGWQQNPWTLLGMIVMGLMMTLMTGNVMRSHWLKSHFPIDFSSLLAGLALCAASIFGESLIETALLITISLWLVARIVYQGISTYREMA